MTLPVGPPVAVTDTGTDTGLPADGAASRVGGCVSGAPRNVTVRFISDVQKWEYTIADSVISIWKGSTDDQIRQWLANLIAMGNDGWELVSDAVIHPKKSLH